MEEAEKKNTEKQGRKKSGLTEVIRGVFTLLTRREKLELLLLLFLGFTSSLIETVSTGAVLPFMYLLADPAAIAALPVVGPFFGRLIRLSGEKYILLFSAGFIGLYTLRCGYMIVYRYVHGTITRRIQCDFSVRLFSYYASREYEFYFSHNPSLLQRNVTGIVTALISGVVSDTLFLIINVFTAVMLFVLVFLSGTTTLFIAAFCMVAIYFGVTRGTKRRLREMAEWENNHAKEFYRMVMEYFRGIKSIRLLGRNNDISCRVQKESNAINAMASRRDMVNAVPNQVLELGTVIILVVILVAGYLKKGAEAGIASISLCAAAAFRIRSSLFGILNRAAGIRSNSVYYDEIREDLENASAMPLENADEPEPLVFSDRLEAECISYRYPGTERDVISGASFVLKKGEAVGLIGKSGNGKSTMADLLLGLLRPQQGCVRIDGIPLAGNERAWQRIVGYVPQSIFLADASIAENVAFGLPKEKIDTEKVMKALQIAQLAEFVEKLPEKAETKVGDNGILLSGGQRQRIGIARALYNEPKVLVFDEATSSLDGETERNFVATLNSMRSDYTMLIISHRMETVSKCDRILEVKDGKILESTLNKG